MTELSWVQIARQAIGTKEITGNKHNPNILAMWDLAFTATNQTASKDNPPWQNDETPWCGGFMGYVFAKAKLSHHIPKAFPMARAWAKSGTPLAKPAYGCVVVFSRNGGGHVGLCVGVDKRGNLMILGGNQSNQVNIMPIARHRAIAYRWCGTQPQPNPSRYKLPVYTNSGKVSTNEA